MAAEGKVYLVGAGPGAVDLITVKAARILGRAEVIVYDHLSNEELLSLAPESAQRIYAGKRGGFGHAIEQEEINRLLIEKARTGAIVVRLKGGDPFIFGRGGEEALAMAQAGVEFEVVPGITSAIAVPAYAGIPLTHRGFGSFVAFVTGHEDPGKQPPAVPWDELARAAASRGTLVLLMAGGRLRQISARLLAAGLAADTPAAAIQHGTGAAQRTVSTCLDRLADDIESAGLGAPMIVVIGAVAALRERLSWLEQRPLFGRRIVVTRSRSNATRLAERMRALGAEVWEMPAIAATVPDSYAELDHAIAQLGRYNWVIFTSATGVEWFMRRLRELGADLRQLIGASLAAIGPATQRRLLDFGLRCAVVPANYRAEAIVEAIGANRIAGKRFLIPRAQVARETLIELLRTSGAAEVTVAPAYRTVRPQHAAVERMQGALRERAIDLITFTSSSTVNNFCEMVGDAAAGRPAAVIGPITERTARARGLQVVACATSYTVDGLFDAIRDYFATRSGQVSPLLAYPSGQDEDVEDE